MDKKLKASTTSSKKLLGQYFTPKKVAELLATLTQTDEIPSYIIDPMSGQGSLLDAAHTVFGGAPSYYGIEIDKHLYEQSKENLPKQLPGKISLGNSFNPEVFNTLGIYQFDLVITNPPYVRYQSHSEVTNLIGINNIENIRLGLLGILNQVYSKPEKEYDLFKRIINGYSNFSDLSIPSWILCGIITKKGGTLAIIVPDSWLTRDYASPVLWMLIKLFKIKYVVEDSTRTWFSTAQVKTTLLIAERIDIVDNPFSYWKNKFYIRAYSEQKLGNDSPVAGYYPEAKSPPINFLNDIQDLLKQKEINDIKVPFNYKKISLESEAFNTAVRITKNKHLSNELLNPKYQILVKDRPFIPYQLIKIFQTAFPNPVIPETLGIHIGQGLRTGANDFFYLKKLLYSDESNKYLAQTNKLFGSKIIEVPEELTKLAFRFQAELPHIEDLLLRNDADWLLLFLGDSALPKDRERALNINPDLIIKNLSSISPEICEYIDIASKTLYKGKLIPELSAVRTNVNVSDGRFWYNLPSLQDRHMPNIIIPRVNAYSPAGWINMRRELVIDANFSSVSTMNNSHFDPWALFSLFNSITVSTLMELSGTVMGGGALKLEATQLKKIPLPPLTREQIGDLSKIGKQIISGGTEDNSNKFELIDKIFINSDQFPEYISSVKNIKQNHIRMRTKAYSNG